MFETTSKLEKCTHIKILNKVPQAHHRVREFDHTFAELHTGSSNGITSNLYLPVLLLKHYDSPKCTTPQCDESIYLLVVFERRNTGYAIHVWGEDALQG